MSEHELKQQLDDIRDAVGRIEHAINGNGQPGLKTRMALVERWIASADKLVWLVIGSGIASGSAAAFLTQLLGGS